MPAVTEDDHVRGDGPLVIEYADLECPYCARTHLLIRDLPIRRVFRHFPVVSKHPRARVLALAAEAAAGQGRFWDFHDSLMVDQGRLEDPHLWQRCRELGIELARFDSDRRGGQAAERVERDFRAGIRAGVMSTPTLFVAGERHPGIPGQELLDRLSG